MNAAAQPRAVPLQVTTSKSWCEAALSDVPGLLNDHAQCELKAASTALSLIARNPEREELVGRMMVLAREELLHYRQVRDVMRLRGLRPTRPQRSPYLAGLAALPRRQTDAGAGLLDALLGCALVEARSCERFQALVRALQDRDPELSRLYDALARSESGHAHLFVELAELYFPPRQVQDELAARAGHEARVLGTIPVSARMHGGNGTA
jgi:tRNA-(ms[2]io[6]A)-hydroxylase